MIRLLLILLFMSAPAFAGERYAPDYCGFEVTFPQEPVVKRQCDGTNSERCYDLVSYTKTFDLDATVSFEVICNAVSGNVYAEYSAEVMEATLRAMTDKDVIKTYESDARTEGGFKQANLIGEGLRGNSPTLFIAQLWIDRGSAFSVKAELIGGPRTDADQMFSDILKSVRVKQVQDEEISE